MQVRISAFPTRAAMKRFLQVLAAAAVVLFAPAALAQTLSASSVRTYSDPGYKGVEGNLYIVDPDTASTTLVTSLNLGKTPIGLDGLAVHPKTGTFYGITSATAANIPHSLVTVDPTNGALTRVGDLGDSGSDIAFDPEGILYVWLANTRQIGVVDLETGRATPRGKPIERGASKGAFALIGNGKAYLASTGGAGTIDILDIQTGMITTGPTLSGAPFPDLMTGLAYSSRGVLYGINANFGRSSQANLVVIDPHTGKVTNVGALPNDTDAITFGPTPTNRDLFSNVMEWRLPVLVALFVFAMGVLFFAMRTKKPGG